MCKLGNSVTKRFTFTGPVIEVLRARGKGPSVKNPTRVEAVSRFYDIVFGWGRPVWGQYRWVVRADVIQLDIFGGHKGGQWNRSIGGDGSVAGGSRALHFC
ncbi:hypothetical protein CRG98_041230 [Punica granatum]|uniref:Uncharacterized protein n=1 Tax=Punica granatum TaxID=22663 RepID=A0A2I0I3U5_PUNGR|nr:hypothetical protein CRG98_041230 [Punica granatum]